MIDFSALEEALDAIKEVGEKTITFDLKGTPITLRVIRPHEEIEVQKWAMTSVEEEKTNATLAEYLDRVKVGTLSYVLIGIGDQDFDTDIIVSNEKLQNGKAVKHRKHTYLREKLSTWSRPLIHNIYKKFGELMEMIEMETENAIEFDPPDLKAEIERREETLKELKEKLSERDKEDEDFRAKQIRAAIELENIRAAETAEEYEQTQQTIDEITQPRQRTEKIETGDYQPREQASDLRQHFDNRNVQFAEHQLRTEEEDEEDSRVHRTRPEISRVQQSRPLVETQTEDYGSFAPPDNQARQAAIQEEQQRLLRERQARMESRRQAQTDVRRYNNVQAQPRTGRVPPHAGAAEIGKQISSVGGVPVFLPEGTSEEDLFSQAVDGLEGSSQSPRPQRPNNNVARRNSQTQKPRR